mgnify:CR=1 FL=1
MRISETALAIALWLIETSPDGLRTPVMFDALAAAFPDAPKGELEEACFELEHLGFVCTSGAIGHAVRSVRPHYALLWAFDPTVLGTDPNADAVELARLMLEDASLGSIRDCMREWVGRGAGSILRLRASCP